MKIIIEGSAKEIAALIQELSAPQESCLAFTDQGIQREPCLKPEAEEDVQRRIREAQIRTAGSTTIMELNPDNRITY